MTSCGSCCDGNRPCEGAVLSDSAMYFTFWHRYGGSVSAIESLDLGKSHVRRLREAGVTTLSELAQRNRREIGAIRGIGPKTLDKIEQAASEAGIRLAVDPLTPYQCVREGRDAWDVRLCSFFLCDDCVADWTRSAFRLHGPLYDEVLLSGTCQNCNRNFEALRLAQWFLCGNCERVARSIGRSVAAEEYVANRFEELFRGTSLRVVQLDHPVLRAHYARMLDTKTATIDFAICNGEEKIAGIELKTGRNHLGGWAPVGSKIATFQAGPRRLRRHHLGCGGRENPRVSVPRPGNRQGRAPDYPIPGNGALVDRSVQL